MRIPLWGKEQRIGLEFIEAVDVIRRKVFGAVSFWTIQVTFRVKDDGKQFVTVRQDILYADKKTATIAREAIAVAITRRLRQLAAVESKPLWQIKTSAEDALWESGFYVRGSQMRRWQGGEDGVRASQHAIRLHDLLQHPLMPHDDGAAKHAALITHVRDLFSRDSAFRRRHNAAFMAGEAKNRARFFADVESKGLTPEQIQAALAFDDANMAVAAAGSGKTSVLVAKAGYALLSGYCESADDILALAFNSKAAKDMQKRLSTRLTKALKRPIEIEARTFHSMGNSLLEKPPEANRWNVVQLDSKEGTRIFLSALDWLLENDSEFQKATFEWLAFARYPEPTMEAADEDLREMAFRYEAACLSQLKLKKEGRSRRRGPSIPTYDVKVNVRSLEERAIANWLYVRNITFSYEFTAPDRVLDAMYGPHAPADKRPYRPDFSYPPPIKGKARVFHEHFAIGRNGLAPEFMGGARYVEQAESKRSAFQTAYEWLTKKGQRIPLFETTSAQYRDGTLFDALERNLQTHGVAVGPVDRDRMAAALKEFRDASKAESLFLEFIQGFRESGMSREEVEERARTSPLPYRARLFLNVAFRLLDEIEKRFEGHSIEFCDMLSRGADALRRNGNHRPYKLILVDEFQDTSRLRMELVDALAALAPEGCVLFMVGDDWQAINRFAGADIRYFQAYAPKSSKAPSACLQPNHHGITRGSRSTHLVWLSKTFRSCQGIADVSRSFMLSTPGQLDKRVEADLPDIDKVIKIVEHEDNGLSRLKAIRAELEEIAALPQPLDEDGNPRLNEVFLLTRNMAETVVPEGTEEESVSELVKAFSGRITLTRSNMHKTKGLEADFVIIAGMDTGYRGFPNLWDTDPLLELVLPPMANPFEEERRLFYVALTRAKKKTILLAAGNRPSQFVFELGRMEEMQTRIEWMQLDLEREICPTCGQGSLRLNYNGTHVRCSRYPRCGFKAPREEFPHVGRTGGTKTAT